MLCLFVRLSVHAAALDDLKTYLANHEDELENYRAQAKAKQSFNTRRSVNMNTPSTYRKAL